MHAPDNSFDVAAFTDFDRVVDPAVYRPLPEDWWLALTDVTNSTDAIAAGRYKAVNMAGAAAISAVMNALRRRDIPFVFAGDGASLAVAPDEVERVREALARTVRWAAEELGLELRAGLVPIRDIRAEGRDVLVAHYAPSPAVRYAMFAGGGLAWAEAELKAGRLAIPAAPPGARPDLSGLSCRWDAIGSRHGVILSLIVRQGPRRDAQAFTAAVRRLLALLAREEAQGRPVDADRLRFKWPPQGSDLEARALAKGGPLALRRLRVLGFALFAWAVFKLGLRMGAFDPDHYRAQTVLNADFRKFDDGLHMTIDCAPESADRIEAMLAAEEAAGVVRYGSWRQSAALMTCLVSSMQTDNHLHFIDGAEGGYAAAARRLKSPPSAEAAPPLDTVASLA